MLFDWFGVICCLIGLVLYVVAVKLELYVGIVKLDPETGCSKRITSVNIDWARKILIFRNGKEGERETEQ